MLVFNMLTVLTFSFRGSLAQNARSQLVNFQFSRVTKCLFSTCQLLIFEEVLRKFHHNGHFQVESYQFWRMSRTKCSISSFQLSVSEKSCTKCSIFKLSAVSLEKVLRRLCLPRNNVIVLEKVLQKRKGQSKSVTCSQCSACLSLSLVSSWAGPGLWPYRLPLETSVPSSCSIFCLGRPPVSVSLPLSLSVCVIRLYHVHVDMGISFPEEPPSSKTAPFDLWEPYPRNIP